jgi:hypothetical protein
LFDPYIGQDAAFVQVTPLLGTLPPLVVMPVGKSPMEGWRFLPEADTGTSYQSQTFEGVPPVHPIIRAIKFRIFFDRIAPMAGGFRLWGWS